MPECDVWIACNCSKEQTLPNFYIFVQVILAECAVYLARAPKSPEIYLALAKVKDSIQNYEGNLPGVNNLISRFNVFRVCLSLEYIRYSTYPVSSYIIQFGYGCICSVF